MELNMQNTNFKALTMSGFMLQRPSQEKWQQDEEGLVCRSVAPKAKCIVL